MSFGSFHLTTIAMDSDTKLRLRTSCATAHGHYDQIVAVSQKIINESFDNLYDVYPEYGKVDFSSKKIGKVKGNLYSPRLLLGGGLGADLSLTSALYIMRYIPFLFFSSFHR